ncbi:hypothetical protein JCM3765_004750 [Sporobolomyces pararoseus]
MFLQPSPPLSVKFSAADRAPQADPPRTILSSASSISLSPLSFVSDATNQDHLRQEAQFNPEPTQRPHSRISSSTSSTLSSIGSDCSEGGTGSTGGVSQHLEARKRDGPSEENDEREKEEGEEREGEEQVKDLRSMKPPSKNQATSFICKLYSILEDPNNIPLISYGRLPGSFEVHDIVALSRDVLPNYFKHSNFASFARQLNMWGWRKESRHGGWIFLHPIFRAGRRDLLVHIKRSDEAGKKRPDGGVSRLDTEFLTSQPLQSSPPLISPLFNPDGSHTRPVLPPSFVDDPRPCLPPPSRFGGPETEQRQHSVQSSSHAMQLEEAKRRLTMTTTLLEHVLEKLRGTEEQENFQSFPFYVLDPRFRDPATPLQAIVAEYDAQRVANSVPPAPAHHPPQNRLANEFPPPHPDIAVPLLSRYAYNTSSYTPLPTFPTILPNLTSSHASHQFDTVPIVSPMDQPPYDSSYSTRHGSLGTNFSGASPQDSNGQLDFSFDNQPNQGMFSSTTTRVVSPEDDTTNLFQYNRNETEGLESNFGNAVEGGGNRVPFSHHSLRLLHSRPSTAASTIHTVANTLGPSSFSLVDFSNNRAPSRNSEPPTAQMSFTDSLSNVARGTRAQTNEQPESIPASFQSTVASF